MLMSLKEIIDYLDRKYGVRPHKATIVRWRTKGAKGVLLKSTRLGGQSYTSESDLLEFMERLNAPSDDVSVPQATPRQQERAAHKSAAQLKKRLGVA